jgi:hypothetical protein
MQVDHRSHPSTGFKRHAGAFLGTWDSASTAANEIFSRHA